MEKNGNTYGESCGLMFLFSRENIFCAALALTAAAVFKLWFAGSGGAFFLLAPADFLFGLLTGSKGEYIAQRGFYHACFNIIIDKSCAGANFFILTFILFSYEFTVHTEKLFSKLFSLFCAAVFTYPFCIAVNSARIFTALAVREAAGLFVSASVNRMLHEAAGVLINLFFLISAYLFLNRILEFRFKHKTNKEKI